MLPPALRRVQPIAAVADWFDRFTGRVRQRELEADLLDAHAEIDRLRARLADATRPSMQFARMKVREVALARLARLRLARGKARRGVREEPPAGSSYQ